MQLELLNMNPEELTEWAKNSSTGLATATSSKAC